MQGVGDRARSRDGADLATSLRAAGAHAVAGFEHHRDRAVGEQPDRVGNAGGAPVSHVS
jgi:hypothetical protein